MPDVMEIHVLGSNEGESIAVKLPNGKWGVIDSFAPANSNESNHPTAIFLASKGISKLEFLCLTHPHQDHFQGMKTLLDAFEPKVFFVFNATAPQELFSLIATILEAKAKISPFPDQDKLAHSEFVSLISGVTKLALQGKIQRELIQLGMPVIDEDVDGVRLKITALGPSGQAVVKYEESLKKCFSTDESGAVLAERPPAADHNLISSGFLVEFGESRVTLGGDIEESGWRSALNWKAPRLQFESVLVKVSHHGSTNGYCERLWEDHLSPNKLAFAVITPFSKKKLPSEEGLGHIKNHAKGVAITSRSTLQSYARADLSKGLALDAALAVNETFRNASKPAISKHGVCSFVIDHKRNVTKSFAGDAGEI